MFLLLLMGLGAAGVKAQVRIGGNSAPNAAAVLDLNATDAATGTKGLALPRVNLTSATMQLTTGVANLTGMLVYNTTTTLGQIGIYYWNGTKWVQASLPSPAATDTFSLLYWNGTNWRPATSTYHSYLGSDTLHPRLSTPVTFQIALDTTLTRAFIYAEGSYGTMICQGASPNWLCTSSAPLTYVNASSNVIEWATPNGSWISQGTGFHIRCYKPSV